MLLGTIALVALATLIEVRSLRKCCNTSAQSVGCSTGAAEATEAAAAATAAQTNKRFLGGYRSLSFSSSCSSQLFCSSASSVASSSLALILNKRKGGGEPSTRQPQPPATLQSCECNIGVEATATSYAKLAKQLLLSFSVRQSASQIFQLAPAANAHSRQRRKKLCRCRLNSPSAAAGGDWRASQAAQPAPSQLRSRVSSLSSGGSESALTAPTSIATSDEHETDSSDSSSENEEPNRRPAKFARQNSAAQSAGRRESQPSIDSLHGLRFLSMIWVIVVHSYNFALRWTLFAAANPIDEIYKSLLSQVLANGSFACDTFFFAAGFLLPYLAISAGENQVGTRKLEEEEEGGPDELNTQQALGKKAQEYCKSDEEEEEEEAPPPKRTATCRKFAACKSKVAAAQSSDNLFADNSNRTNRCQLAPRQTSFYSANKENFCTNLQEAAASIHVTQLKFGANKEAAEQEKVVVLENEEGGVSENNFPLSKVFANLVHRYVRMMPLMMAIIGLSATLLRYLGEGPVWNESTLMYDKWCRKNWWINALFLHNFLDRENMCLSHSWYSAVDIQLFLMGQLILFALFKSKKLGLALLCSLLIGSQLITGLLTVAHHLPAVPLVASVSEKTMNLYYGEIYIKPYCRASPYLVGMLLAYLMRTTSLGNLRLKQVSFDFRATFTEEPL